MMKIENNTADLISHINAINEKSRQWAAEVPGRWAGMLTTDLEHWNSMEIFTPEDFDKYELANEAYELTKELYHYKPSWSGLMSMTIEELETEVAGLGTALRQELEHEEAMAKAEAEEEARYKTFVEDLLNNDNPLTQTLLV